MRKRDHQGRMLHALNHKIRRDIVKLLIHGPSQVSPIAVSRSVNVKVANLSYHFRVLHDNGVLELIDEQPKRGAVEHFYGLAPHVADDPIIRAVLDGR